MNKKDEAPADPMAEDVSKFDHETGKLYEPKVEDEPRVRRHQVDPIRNPMSAEDAEEVGNGPVPRRGDPFAHQRDAKAAKAEAAKQAAEDKKAADKK